MAISNSEQGMRPGVCTSTSRPSAPYEGQMIYETDTDKVLVWNGSAWLYLSTPQTIEPGVWTSYTPTWTALTVGNGTQAFKYTVVNKLVHVFGRITFGSTTSISSIPTMSLPVARVDAQLSNLGTGLLGDSGTASYSLVPLSISTTGVLIFREDHTAGSSTKEGAIGASSPFTWVAGDFIQVNLTYEAA